MNSHGSESDHLPHSSATDESQQDRLRGLVESSPLRRHQSQDEIYEALPDFEAAEPEGSVPVETLVHLTQQLSASTDYNALLDSVLQAVIGLNIAERGMLFLDIEGRVRTARTYHAKTSSFDEDEVRVSQSLVKRCLTERRTVMMEKGKGSSTPSAETLQLLSAVCLPIRDQGEVMGGLYLDSTRHVMGSKNKVKLLEAYAALASVCLSYQKNISAGHEEIDGLRRRNEQLYAEVKGAWKLDNLLGESPAWLKVLGRIRSLKDVDDTVLILGETGTGKDEIARALHYEGRRKQTGPFIAINCAAVPENLLEAELFGTVEGGFTGAKTRLGLVEQANGGTIFLDEIGDMAPSLQPKILRFVEDRSFARVGAPSDQRKVDVRVVAATNRDLHAMMEGGEFRADLYYRLNGSVIRAPALREHVEDLRLLLDHFLAHERERFPTKQIELAPEARRLLLSYDWPGNVRELKLKLSSICATVEEGKVITADLVAEELDFEPASGPAGIETIKDARARAERDCLSRALRRHEWDIRAASEDLGMSRQNVYNLIKTYDLERPMGISSRPRRLD